MKVDFHLSNSWVSLIKKCENSSDFQEETVRNKTVSDKTVSDKTDQQNTRILLLDGERWNSRIRKFSAVLLLFIRNTSWVYLLLEYFLGVFTNGINASVTDYCVCVVSPSLLECSEFIVFKSKSEWGGLPFFSFHLSILFGKGG